MVIAQPFSFLRETRRKLDESFHRFFQRHHGDDDLPLDLLNSVTRARYD
jgi:hypothetical protein